MALISKKWNGKDVEMVVAKSEVLYSHLPGETEGKERRGGGRIMCVLAKI